jgi:hypothetical protein
MINGNPTEYSVVLENWNEDKATYMAQLESLFQKYIHEQEKVYNSFAYIVSAMNRWYMSLPKYAKEMTKSYRGHIAKDQFKTVSASHKKFVNSLKQLDINPRDYLFEKVFEIYWSKCEWEIIVGPWCGGRDTKEIKIDVFDQVMYNWEHFLEYVWNERKRICLWDKEIKERLATQTD